MKKLQISFRSVFLLTLFLILCSHCVYSYEKYERTWTQNYWLDENPGITRLPFFDLWDNTRFQPTIDSINPQGAALNAKSATTTDYKSCLPYYSKYRQEVLENAAKQITYGGLDLLWNCYHYVDDWRNTMELSISDLDESEEKAEQLNSQLELSQASMAKKGLCEPNYQYSGKEECLEVKNMLLLYPQISENHKQLSLELQNPFPDMTSYSYYLSYSKQAITKFELSDSIIQTGETKAESEYSSYLLESETKKKNVELKISKLDDEEISLITSNPTSTSIESLTTVSKSFAQIKDIKNTNDIDFDAAKKRHENSDSINYLANSIGQMDKTKDTYAKLDTQLDDLKSYAEKTVDQKKAEAEVELEKAAAAIKNGGGSDAIAAYNKAKAAFDRAQNSKTLGSAFKNYDDAVQNSINAQSSDTSVVEIQNAQKIALLEDLIKRAQTDDITVSTEIVTLQKIKENKYENSNVLIDEAINSISNRAQILYYNLPQLRSEVASKISLSRQTSLLSELNVLEQGAISNGQIVYPDAIGKLKKLNDGYLSLLAKLNNYSKDILSNGMETRGRVVIQNARIDQPATITLDLLFSNTQNYGGSNVPARAKMSSNFEFFYSDIKSGKEFVSSLRSDNNDLIFILPQVQSHETYRITLEKNKILARSLESSQSVVGIANEQAKVKTTINFELTDDINSLEYDGPFSIDNGHPNIISKGKHTLTSEKSVSDAYVFETSAPLTKDIDSHQLVSFDIFITPNMDLDSLTTPLAGIDGTQISKLKITPSNGENIKVQNGKQIILTLGKLQKGQKISLSMSYEIDNTKSYVENKLKELGQYPLGPTAKALYEEAIKKANAGEYASALSLIENAALANEKDKKDSFKSSAKLDELLRKLNDELIDLDVQTSINHSFVSKIQKRKTDLESIKSSLKNLSQTDQLTRLSKIDFAYLPKELSNLKKQINKDYHDFSDRYFKSGKLDTPTEFVSFENEYEHFDQNQTAHQAVKTLESLDVVRQITENSEATKGNSSAIIDAYFADLKIRINSLNAYYEESEEAKDSDYAKLFTEDKQSVLSKLKDLENSKNDERLFWPKFKDLNNTANKMQKTLGLLKSESDAKIKLLDQTLSLSTFDSSKKKDLSDKLSKIKKLNSDQKYISAIKSSISLLREFETIKGDNTYIWIILLVILALGGIAYLYLQQQKPKPKELKPLLKVKQEVEQ